MCEYVILGLKVWIVIVEVILRAEESIRNHQEGIEVHQVPQEVFQDREIGGMLWWLHLLRIFEILCIFKSCI